MVINKYLLQNSPFYVNFFFLRPTSTKLTVKMSKYSKTIWQRNIQTPSFFFFLFFLSF